MTEKAKERKKLIKELDKQFSLNIRKEFPKCVFCGKKTRHCFHFVTRAKYSVRWHRLNAVGSCAGCNFRYEFDPHFAILWYLSIYGEVAYRELVRAGNEKFKETNEGLKYMLGTLRGES